MYLKIFSNIFFVLLLFILQFSFISTFVWYFSGLNILLVSILFILVLYGSKKAFFWSLGFGFFSDVFSFDFFGLYILSFLFSFLVIYFLQNNFLTNRSLKSFIVLITFSLFVFKIVLYSLSFLAFFWAGEESIIFWNQAFLKSEIYSFLVNGILVIMVFYIVNFLSKRLKPSFLLR
jgi:cell shape-determining protein MreD